MTSLDSYRITLLGLQQGLSDAEIRAMGGGASQFTMTTGVPLAAVAQTDIGLFGEDSWRIRPNFTLNYGLRFETQNNIPKRSPLSGDRSDKLPLPGLLPRQPSALNPRNALKGDRSDT